MYNVNRMPPQQHIYAYQPPTHTPPLQTQCVYPPQEQVFGPTLRFDSPATSLLSPYSEEYYSQGVTQQTTNPPLPEPGYFTKPSVVPVQPQKSTEGKPVDFGKLSFSQQPPAEVPKVPSFGAGVVTQSTPASCFKFNSNFKSNDGDFTFSSSQAKGSETLLGLLTSDFPSKAETSPEKPLAQQPTSQGNIFTFGTKNASSRSFADTAQSSVAGAGFGKMSKPFKFGDPDVPEKAAAADSDNESTRADEDEEGPHFEPIVPLPDKVDVKTGEEEEEEMFCNRVKLYRFDTETKEWKERGIGNVKILKHNTKGKVRLLMRREQVLKICANHYITTDMQLKPNAGSDKSWVWNAIDYADEEPKPEHLAIRFKTVDEASHFKTKFEEAQKIVIQSPEKNVQQEKKEESVNSKMLIAQFAIKEGEWECDVCCIRNKPTDVKCVACQTPNPNAASKPDGGLPSDTKSSPFAFKFGIDSSKPSSSAAFTGFGAFGPFGDSSKPSFTFGTSTSKPADTSTSSGFGFGFQFGLKSEQWDCGTCATKNQASAYSCASCKAPKGSTKATVAAQTATAAEPTTGFASGFGAQFAKKPGQWDCDVCDVRNEATVKECVSCRSPNPASKSTETASVPTTLPIAPGCGTDVNTSDKQWDCNTCLVRNDASAAKCVSCQTVREKPSLEAMFAKKNGEWDCDTCLVRNSASVSKCLSCQTPNPNYKATESKAPKSSPFSFKVSQSFKTGAAAPFGSSSAFQFGLNKDQNSAASFKFEPPSTESSTTTSSGFSFSMPIPSGGFKFGIQDKTDEAPAGDGAAPLSGSASNFLKSMADKHNEKQTSMPVVDSLSAEKDNNPIIFGKPDTCSFADLANTSGDDFQFGQKDPNFKGFSRAGEQVFSSLTATPTKTDDQEDDGLYKTEENDDIQFEPVIQMPDKVDVVTGEEDEQVLYSQRVKLFRFDTETGQWKERGVGNLKLLKNSTNGRLRVLMRREQVLKVCANHWITTTMNLKPLAGSDKAWMWMANDFSDDEAKMEQLAAKFKTCELAEEFKKKFEECQILLLDIPLQTPHKLVNTDRTAHLIQKAEEMKSGLKDLKFFLTDEKTKIKDDDNQEDLTTASSVSSLVMKAQSETPGPTLEWDNYDLRDESLNSTIDSSSIYASPQVRKNLFRFGESTGGFNFSFQPGISPSKSPAQLNQSRASVGTDDEQDPTQDEERDNHYFEPVVPLPDLVDISTGEENEQVIFSHRAKLYRYHKEIGQWKERGIGDLKILQNYDTKRVRLIMRRDQVLKICANHWISTAMKLEPMKGAEKAWVWSALDFAEEGEGKIEQLAVRFKLQETANVFKQVFEEAKVAQAKEELMTPVTPEVVASENSVAEEPGRSEGAPVALCGEAAIAVLEETTKERTEPLPESKQSVTGSPSPLSSSKTVMSPAKFVFGMGSVQKFFDTARTVTESEESASSLRAKDAGRSAKTSPAAPTFKIPEKGKVLVQLFFKHMTNL